MIIAAISTSNAADCHITLHFEGDWQSESVFISAANETGCGNLEYDTYYFPVAEEFVYEFSMPYNPVSNTPGLNIGVASGYELSVAILDGEGLINSSLAKDSNADYMLSADSDSGWSRRVDGLESYEGIPRFGDGANLSLFTEKVNGHTFVISVREKHIDPLDGVTLLFSGFDWSADTEELQVIAQTEDGRTYVGASELSSGSYFYSYGDSGQLTVFCPIEDFDIQLGFDELVEGQDYKLQVSKGLLGGTNYAISLYSGAKGSEIRISHTQDGQTTGVGIFEEENFRTPVYTIQGVEVSNDILTLPPGLYIRSGSLILIR